MKKYLKKILIAVSVVLLMILLAVGYIKNFLPDVGDPPYLTIEYTPERVARGEYLANHVTVCMDCHSQRDWTLYSGPMSKDGIGAGGEVFNREMGFPGIFYAPNITPFKTNMISDGELMRSIASGVDYKGRALFPLMAYHRYGQMDVEDLYSIIAYLRKNVKSVEKVVPEREIDFPVNILINTMPKRAAYSKIPSQKNIVKYGEYMANAAGCVDCHSQLDKGTVVPGTEFGGGMAFKFPKGILRSPNITPDNETGIGSWTKEAFNARFKMYAVAGYVPEKMIPGEPNTPMPWTMYAGMKTSDLEAIYAYLQSIKPIKNKVIIREKQ